MSHYSKTSMQRDADKKIGAVFKEKLDIWMKNNGGKIIIDGKERKRNQSTFAAYIHTVQSQVSKWISGKSQPSDDDFKAIIKTFNDDGIPTYKEEFLISTDDDLHKYSEPYINKLIEIIINMYTEESWMDFVQFLKFLKTIPGYDQDFPLTTDIEKDPDQEHRYKRQDLSALPSAAKSTYYGYFQIDKGDKGLRLLRTSDIDFLDEVRNAVITLIREMMKKRAKDLNEAVNHANFISLNEQRDLTDHELYLVDAMNKGSSHLDAEGMNLVDDYKYITENGELFIEEDNDDKVSQEGSDKPKE